MLLTRLRRVPPSRWGLLAEAGLELARASLELRLLGTARTARLLGAPSDADAVAEPAVVARAARVGRAVDSAARNLPWHPTCLRQAIAVRRMLARRGIAGRIHLGVTDPSSTRAHAWVTVGSDVVAGGAGVEQFVPLAAFSR